MVASANLSNWREAEHSRWAFQNIDKVLPTHTIRKGPQTTSLETGRPQTFDTFRLKLHNGSVQDWPTFLSWTETDGVVVLHHGKIVHEQYANGNSKQTKHILMSASKSICGLIAGILSAQGKLDLQAPVTQYVPEVSESSLKHATVRQCLDMRSNVKYDDHTEEYRMAVGWNPVGDGDKATNLHDFLGTLKASSLPKVDGLDGAPFEYATVNTDLIGWVLERAAGGDRSYSQLVSDLLWSPMGAASDALMTVDSAGNARAGGGVCATLQDLARVGQLILDGGRDVVPQGWIEDMLHGGSPEAFAASIWPPMYHGALTRPVYRSYWVTDEDTETIIALGSYGQHLYIDRKNGIVMAKTSTQSTPLDGLRFLATNLAFREVERILTSES